MKIEEDLFDAAESLAKKRYPNGWAGAAAVRTESGKLGKSSNHLLPGRNFRRGHPTYHSVAAPQQPTEEEMGGLSGREIALHTIGKVRKPPSGAKE